MQPGNLPIYLGPVYSGAVGTGNYGRSLHSSCEPGTIKVVGKTI